MIEAVGYLRVSGKSQLDGDGFERQRLAIQEFAKANGYVITEWFEERGVTGKSEWEDREAWISMILSGAKVIIVEALHRLAREFAVQEIFLRELRKRKVELISAAEPGFSEDDGDPSRRLIRGVLGLLAEYDRSQIVLKLRAARKRKKARGEHAEGDYPFGGHPQNPHESETLAVMRSLYSSGLSFHAVSVEMNRRGLKPRRAERWHYATVQRILQRVA